MVDMKRLRDIAKVVRSKNAGPFEVTFDVIFEDDRSYQAAKAAAVLTPALIAQLYRVPEAEILVCGWFDSIRAFKATIPRRQPQGGIGERDMHACQQHAPLAELLFPVGS